MTVYINCIFKYLKQTKYFKWTKHFLHVLLEIIFIYIHVYIYRYLNIGIYIEKNDDKHINNSFKLNQNCTLIL